MNVKQGNHNKLKLNDSTLIDSVAANKPYKLVVKQKKFFEMCWSLGTSQIEVYNWVTNEQMRKDYNKFNFQWCSEMGVGCEIK